MLFEIFIIFVKTKYGYFFFSLIVIFCIVGIDLKLNYELFIEFLDKFVPLFSPNFQSVFLLFWIQERTFQTVLAYSLEVFQVKFHCYCANEKVIIDIIRVENA